MDDLRLSHAGAGDAKDAHCGAEHEEGDLAAHIDQGLHELQTASKAPEALT